METHADYGLAVGRECYLILHIDRGPFGNARVVGIARAGAERDRLIGDGIADGHQDRRGCRTDPGEVSGHSSVVGFLARKLGADQQRMRDCAGVADEQIGRESWRERGCKYRWSSYL